MYEIVCEDQPAERILAVSARLSSAELPGFFAEVFPALYGTVGRSGASPAGPPRARYQMVGADAFQVTAGVPFAGELTPDAGQVVEEVPAGSVAMTMHIGSYEGVAAAYQALSEWIQHSGYAISGDPWEWYLDGPEVAQPRTKVCFPVVRS